MTEWQQLILAIVAWEAVVIFALLYSIGGRTAKWIRRFVGGLFIAAATNALAAVNGTWSAWMLVSFATIPASLSMGYSGGIVRRALFGAAVSANIWVFALPVGNWVAALFQQVLGVSASVVFGVTNPFKNAAKEEAVIGGMSVQLIPMVV